MNPYSVYLITHTPTGTVYVGTTYQQPTTTRWQKHQTMLSQGSHSNKPLQTAWNSSDKSSFEFKIIEDLGQVTRKEASAHERSWISAFPEVYNIMGTRKFGDLIRQIAKDPEVKKRRTNSRTFEQRSAAAHQAAQTKAAKRNNTGGV